MKWDKRKATNHFGIVDDICVEQCKTLIWQEFIEMRWEFVCVCDRRTEIVYASIIPNRTQTDNENCIQMWFVCDMMCFLRRKVQ